MDFHRHDMSMKRSISNTVHYNEFLLLKLAFICIQIFYFDETVLQLAGDFQAIIQCLATDNSPSCRPLGGLETATPQDFCQLLFFLAAISKVKPCSLAYSCSIC